MDVTHSFKTSENFNEIEVVTRQKTQISNYVGERRLLGRGDVRLLYEPTFRRNILPPSSG
jgi:hypothetical protein